MYLSFFLSGPDGNVLNLTYIVVCQLFICVFDWFGVGFGAKKCVKSMLKALIFISFLKYLRPKEIN